MRQTGIVRAKPYLDENGELRKDTPRIIVEALAWQKKRWDNGQSATAEDLALKVKYCQGKKNGAISEVLRGKRPVSDDVLSQFARVFGCRLEYLKGIDDFRTDADIIKAEQETHAESLLNKDTERFNAHVKILELLGYTLKPQLYLTGNESWALSKHWDAIKDTLTDDALATPIGNGRTLADWDGHAEINLGLMWRLPARRIWPGLKVTRNEGREYDQPSVIYRDDTDIHYVVEYVISRSGKVAFSDRNELGSLFKRMDDRMNELTVSYFGFGEDDYGKH